MVRPLSFIWVYGRTLAWRAPFLLKKYANAFLRIVSTRGLSDEGHVLLHDCLSSTVKPSSIDRATATESDKFMADIRTIDKSPQNPDFPVKECSSTDIFGSDRNQNSPYS
jgi:hypothetical protein